MIVQQLASEAESYHTHDWTTELAHLEHGTKTGRLVEVVVPAVNGVDGRSDA